VRALANVLSRGGEDVVVLYGERLLGGANGESAARALLGAAERLRLGGRGGAGLLEVHSAANARGLREVGVLPNAGPGLSDPPAAGKDAPGIAAALADGELTALYLLHADPLRTHPDRGAWERALTKATTVIAHASFLTDGVREHANVVFPAASYAEKEGTVVHPDGRLQRLRPAIGRPGDVRMEWQVLADLAARLGTDLEALTGAMASQQVFDAVPFYAGLTLDGLGGRGERWPAREQASALPAGEEGPFASDALPASAPSPNGKLVLGTYRSIWAAPEVEVSPALKFLAATQRAELSPADAERLGLRNGQRVAVAHNGSRVEATVALRSAVPEGFVFMEEAIAQDGANALTSGDGSVLVEVTPS
jgi:NADH-quinone oxidoreductase subunit G